MQNIVFKFPPHSSSLSSSNPDCICLVDKKIWRELPDSTRQKAIDVVSAIANGTPCTLLGGKIVKSNPSLIRFRIGRSLRLILSQGNHHQVFKLFRRQGYEKHFKHL
ncbi:hypothetical protein AB4516_20200 [Vibrio sp. 10N.222.54.F12]|uniref:ParE family toxin-like protein n=1 Tax=Vibrio TaxID=662 RepID=UPI000C85F328|nr:MULTISPECIES: hypothetical protein [Vibrio]PMI70143.1 hypothetical protein BCU63_20165 [Vibrio splendidus]PMJ48642.1 hypothetical protein BCU23_25095 [Vibrio splendidus]PML11189.1 hypothetical protein BCT83_22005 [Vibrio tasmaniensis]PML42695.1 hypothetical protein BCT76_21985 [Vibrio tasmaniensis]